MKAEPINRRRAAARFASWLAAAPLLGAKQVVGEPPGRIAPAGELVNAFEFEAMAQRSLNAAAFARVADGGRGGFDRITLRPRMMVNALGLDLTTELFGEKLFTPIVVGPVAEQTRFHVEGERAMAQGAAAAKTVLVVSGRSSLPLEAVAAQTKGPLWCQVDAQADAGALRARMAKAVDAGCKVLFVTLGTAATDWSALERARQGLRVPVVLKGIMSAEEAREAAVRGFAGIVVSNYGGLLVPGLASPIDALPAIAEALGGKVPILIDGGVRRGTDVLKALALGARAVLLGRPPIWALAAYGAAGVEALLGMLQAELARNMAMCGKLTVAELDSSLVTIHRR